MGVGWCLASSSLLRHLALSTFDDRRGPCSQPSHLEPSSGLGLAFARRSAGRSSGTGLPGLDQRTQPCDYSSSSPASFSLITASTVASGTSSDIDSSRARWLGLDWRKQGSSCSCCDSIRSACCLGMRAGRASGGLSSRVSPSSSSDYPCCYRSTEFGFQSCRGSSLGP